MSSRRRFASLAVASALALALTVPVAAQDTGSQVTVHLMTCTVTGSADSVSLSATSTPPVHDRDCVEGWSVGNPAYLTVDGAVADTLTETSSLWLDVADGDHELSAGGMGNGLAFTVAGEPVELWAFWDKHEIPDDATVTPEATETPDVTPGATVTTEPTEETEPTTEATETTPEPTATSDDVSAAADPAPELPNTGAGPVADTTGSMALAAAVAGALATAGLAVRRRK